MENKKRVSSLAGKLSRDVFFGTSPDLPKIIEIDLKDIAPNPDQPRKTFHQDALRELASSIEKHGLIQPIIVKRQGDKRYILVAGERRYRAHQLLGKDTIPAIVTEGNADEIALIENIQREDLDPLETAEAFAQMLERHNYTQDELGKVIGKAQNTVSEFLKLNELPDPIKANYRTSDNRPPKSVLLEIARLKDSEEQFRIWEAVQQGGLTVKAARAHRGRVQKPEQSPVTQSLSAGRKFVRTLEGLNSEHFATHPEAVAELAALCQTVSAFLESLPIAEFHGHNRGSD